MEYLEVNPEQHFVGYVYSVALKLPTVGGCARDRYSLPMVLKKETKSRQNLRIVAEVISADVEPLKPMRMKKKRR